MIHTFEEVVEAYLADQAYIERKRQKIAVRETTLPALQAVIQRFLQQETNFKTFVTQLDTIFHQKEDWGTTGFGFLMELNKFSKYHNDTNNEAEEHFRTMLRGLNSSNVGQHIEAFFNFLLQERERLRRAGKSSGMIVPPARSAFIISLFAYWLDPVEPSTIYYESLRKGIFMLVTAQLLPELPHSMLGPNSIDIKKATEHREIVRLVNSIMRQAPQLQLFHNWVEVFFGWVSEEFRALSATNDTFMIKDTLDDTILTTEPTRSGKMQVSSRLYETDRHRADTTQAHYATAETLVIEHTHLKPTPEPLLTDLIHKVQHHIVIEEATIRRIYHALLAGHVIFTGPPGTGKTELARLIPELLWQSERAHTENKDDTKTDMPQLSTETAFTTHLVTATDDWSPRTLISGIMPQSEHGTIIYKTQPGHLTATILKNWSAEGDHPEEWSTLSLQRTRIITHSGIDRTQITTFKGVWLVIDEFNRAPIDLALGEALTALGGNNVLRVGIDNGHSTELPIPHDFRIIGTLNSFDRSYLNQISEALKRRFSFVEILPPTRQYREEEQGIVLSKALQKVSHLCSAIKG